MYYHQTAWRKCLAGNEILQISGYSQRRTTNFILTKKDDKRADVILTMLLKSLQKLGYAEADPTADVEG